MKLIAISAAVVGIMFGALWTIGPFYFGTPDGSWASYILPIVWALVVMRTHFLNLRRFRDKSANPSRWRLLTYNLLLLSLFVLGATMMYQRDARFRQMPTGMAIFLALGLASFAICALYLCLPKARQVVPVRQ